MTDCDVQRRKPTRICTMPESQYRSEEDPEEPSRKDLCAEALPGIWEERASGKTLQADREAVTKS